jgi:hypothetical protein
MYSRALQCAAEILGGTEALRAYLGVSLAQLQLWMDYGVKPPDSVFLKIADLLAERQARALRPRPESPA